MPRPCGRARPGCRLHRLRRYSWAVQFPALFFPQRRSRGGHPPDLLLPSFLQGKKKLDVGGCERLRGIVSTLFDDLCRINQMAPNRLSNKIARTISVMTTYIPSPSIAKAI